MNTEEALITEAYQAFNARNIDAVLEVLSPEVMWANGMIDPHVEPLSITRQADGRIHVSVHQVVRDKAGALLVNETVVHLYEIENGLVQRMDIVKE